MESEELIREKYNEALPVFERASYNIKEALSIFLKESDISFLAITTRVKDFSSFYEKIARKKYQNPFVENEDFCGARIILYYLDDIQRVRDILTTEFDVQENENKSENLDINEFGYRSYHFIVKFKEQWLFTPNYRGLQDVKLEIQLRTILMHAWAEIEHKLGYKNKDQVPNEMRRKLFMISAKLEEADGQFQDLKSNIEQYKNELIIDAYREGKFVSKELNLNSFQALLDYYFPNFDKHPVGVAELFIRIQKFKIPIAKIVDIAEKIKPYINRVNELISNNRKDFMTHQSNMMNYAIEAFYEDSDFSMASKSRQEIIDKIRQLEM
jgi:putative GTP pyrophosphokinase